jgi:CubicO group peptidase (beta-lactamase class C family)
MEPDDRDSTAPPRHGAILTIAICTMSAAACGGGTENGSPMEPASPTGAGYEYEAPQAEGYGWELSTLEAEGIDQARIEDLVDDIRRGRFVRIHDIVLARNGKLVFDIAFPETDVIRPGVAWLTQSDGSHYIASATKSIVATTLGIAIDQGLFESEQDRLYDHFGAYYGSFENLDDAKAEITLDDLLTMRAGYQCEDGDGVTMWWDESDMIKYILDRPMAYEPGTGFHYCSGNTNVLGDLIGRKAGLGFEAFLDRYLFEPMGIAEPMYIHHASGKPRLGAGIFMQPRDMARLGQLYLQDGVWEGVRLVSSEWIARSTAPVFALGDGRYYAHHWWRQDFMIDGVAHNLYYAAGNGGQVIYVYPEMQLVIVMTGGNYDDDLMFQNQPIIRDYILPAVIDGGR